MRIDPVAQTYKWLYLKRITMPIDADDCQNLALGLVILRIGTVSSYHRAPLGCYR